MLDLLHTLNGLSPLAVIALLTLVIYQLVRHKRELASMRENDLHHLPEVTDALRRIEVKLSEGFATVIAKLNGK
jgi:uncharacterized membrane protein YhfC